MKAVLLTLVLISLSYCLTFKNLECKSGTSKVACQFSLKNIEFQGYNIIVNGLNNGATAIKGGEVILNVEYKFIFAWVNAYTGTDPTCSFAGTSCDTNGILVGPSQQKTFVLTVGDETPPKGQYRGTAIFYNVNAGDTAKVEYASASMEWNCDDTKCY